MSSSLTDTIKKLQLKKSLEDSTGSLKTIRLSIGEHQNGHLNKSKKLMLFVTNMDSLNQLLNNHNTV